MASPATMPGRACSMEADARYRRDLMSSWTTSGCLAARRSMTTRPTVGCSPNSMVTPRSRPQTLYREPEVTMRSSGRESRTGRRRSYRVRRLRRFVSCTADCVRMGSRSGIYGVGSARTRASTTPSRTITMHGSGHGSGRTSLRRDVTATAWCSTRGRHPRAPRPAHHTRGW